VAIEERWSAIEERWSTDPWREINDCWTASIMAIDDRQ
jgi:hypothetical protein